MSVGGREPPRVSVVLPVRNGAATLPRALASLTAQTLAEWEAIVVDDHSTDETPALLQAAAQRDPRVRVLSGASRGIVGALNAGLAAARARLIARLDADDEAAPSRLERQVAALVAAPADVGVVSCRVEFGGDARAAEGYARYVEWTNTLLSEEEIALNRFVESPFAHPSVLFRRELVDRWGGYRDGDFPEDYELWLRWMDAGVRVRKLRDVLLTWHDSPQRASRRDRRYAPEAFFRLKAPWIARAVQRLLVADAGGAPRALYVWGAGRPTRQRAKSLEAHGVTIHGYIDVDPRKATTALGGRGRPVLLPSELPAPAHAFVLGYVGSRGARELIRAALLARGYVEGRDFLMCA